MTIQIRDLGRQQYLTAYASMQEFNKNLHATAGDQIWLLEHEPVYTLGLSGKREHILNNNQIPIVHTDRGGQVTYHGPGQLIAYLMIDLNKRSYKIKKFVSLIEQSIIEYLQSLGINAERKSKAPGVYIKGNKIAALGVRVRQGRTYHGLALNVDMELSAFDDINPCGYQGMKCTQLSEFIQGISVEQVKRELPVYLLKYFDKTTDILSDVA